MTAESVAAARRKAIQDGALCPFCESRKSKTAFSIMSDVLWFECGSRVTGVHIKEYKYVLRRTLLCIEREKQLRAF